MDRTRRSLLKAGAGTALALAAGRVAAGDSGSRTLLILGGTGFIGPHLTDGALARGWRVTHFNRGRRDAQVADVETLIGDRKGELDALRDRRWDAVVDNTGYVPKFVDLSSRLLAPNTGYCLFISSVAAYASFARPNDEDSPRGVLADPDEENVTNETYGPMKALCEDHVRQAFGARSSIVRPGYIVGPLDPTDRFTYWPVRVAHGGEMAVPGTPADPIQFIDVRDLALFMLGLLDRHVDGVFNAVTAPGTITMGTLIDTGRRVTGVDTQITWIDEDFLSGFLAPDEMKFAPWNPMRGEEAGAAFTSNARALASGLSIRALAETVRDTLAWHQTRPVERREPLRSGLDPQRETALLAAWHARRPA